MSLLTSTEMRTALDVHREPERVRQRYGTTLFGQSSLVARRLVEAGAKLVSVFWDEFGLVNSAWDTHFYHYSLMKEQLCPGFDAAFSTLVLDLEERGLLDETLVVCITEHGRTPKIKSARAAGATIGRGPTARPWPAAASRGAAWWAAPIERPVKWSTRPSRPRTSWPRCTTCWESTRRQ